MKGVELPINILVIVAIAVIVLLGLVALYFTGFGPFSQVAGQEAIKNQACAALNPREGCTTDPYTLEVNFDVDGDGTIAIAQDNWGKFAEAFYGCPIKTAVPAEIAAANACAKRICSCPGY